jgi:flavin-dependent dehydrogenase
MKGGGSRDVHDMSDVAATIGADAAAAADWDAIVVGAGPAGAATALRLARGGWRVLVVDRGGMPRPKVCGACLSPRGVAEIDSLLAGPVPRELAGAVPLAAVSVVAGGARTTIPMPGGVVWSRESLDTTLLRGAIAAGACWLPHAGVSAIDAAGPAGAPVSVVVSLAAAAHGRHAPPTRHVLRGRVAVVATGIAGAIRVAEPPGPAWIAQHNEDDSPGPAAGRRGLERDGLRDPFPRQGGLRCGGIVRPGSRIGLGATLPATVATQPCRGGKESPLVAPPAAGELVMAVGRGGYCGIVRLEDGRLDVAAAVDRRLVAAAGGPAAAIAAILASAAAGGVTAALLAAVRSAAVRATPPLTRTAPLVCGGGRVFRVGDAAGYVEPFTGEGMGWALSAARILAAALVGAAPAAAAYPRAHAECFRGPHARVWRVARGVRHPLVAAGAVRLAAAAPWAAARMLPLFTGVRTPDLAGAPR